MAGVAGYSCSSNDLPEREQVELIVSIHQDKSTRVNMAGNAFEANDEFQIYFGSDKPISTAGAGQVISNYKYQSSQWSVSSGVSIYWDDQSKVLNDFCAVMPFVGYDISDQTYFVETDQSTDANYKKSDLLIALTRTAGRLVPITFYHVYHRLIVNFTDPGSDFDMPFTYDELSLTIPSKGKLTYDGSAPSGPLLVSATAEATPVSTVKMYKNTTDNYFTAIFPPQTIAKDTKLLTIVVTENGTKKTYNYKVDATGGLVFKQGEQTTLTLKLKKTELVLNDISVQEWGGRPAGNSGGTIKLD